MSSTTAALLLLLALRAASAADNRTLADDEAVSRACRLGPWTCLKVRMVADLGRAVASDRCWLARNLVLTRAHGEAPPDQLTAGYVTRLLEDPATPRPGGLLDLVLLKKTLDVFRSHVLTWRVNDRLNATVFRHDGGRGRIDLAVEMLVNSPATAEGRTFGARKRIAMVLLPIVFKLGVMSTLLVGLTVLVLKGLSIGVILLVLAFGNLFGKAAWHPHHGHGWQPPNDIHVHVHVDGQHHPQPAYHGWHDPDHASHVEFSPPHTGYARVGQVEDTPRSFFA